MGIIRDFFIKKKEKEPILYDHERLGLFVYDESQQEWQTLDSEIILAGIKGSEKVPDKLSITRLELELDNQEHYWAVCSNILKAQLREMGEQGINIKEVYKISCIALFEESIEVAFETYPHYKWVSLVVEVINGSAQIKLVES